MDTDLEDFDDDGLDIDQDMDKLEKHDTAKKSGDAAKKPRSWLSVEQYNEDRRLRAALSEFEYD